MSGSPDTTTVIAQARHNLAIIGATRRLMVDLLKEHSLEQINRIPPGFSNNLIWNAAHVAVGLHSVVFRRNNASDQEMAVMAYYPPSDAQIAGYSKGTRPTEDVDQAFVDMVCQQLLETTWFDTLRPEFLLPDRYSSWTTMWGVELHDAGQGLTYINMHEGMHFGVCLGLRKALSVARA